MAVNRRPGDDVGIALDYRADVLDPRVVAGEWGQGKAASGVRSLRRSASLCECWGWSGTNGSTSDGADLPGVAYAISTDDDSSLDEVELSRTGGRGIIGDSVMGSINTHASFPIAVYNSRVDGERGSLRSLSWHSSAGRLWWW